MSDKRCAIRCYDYVNHPYERVRDALKQNALTVFPSATKTARARAEPVAAELHVDFGGIGVNTEIKIVLKRVEERVAVFSSKATTKLLLEWEAATMPRLFPLMEGELSVYPLTSTETQLDLSGIYQPPFGTVGQTMNAIVGHRIAEVSVHRFVSDVAGISGKRLDSILVALARMLILILLLDEGCIAPSHAMLSHGLLLSPLEKRTFHVLIPPDI